MAINHCCRQQNQALEQLSNLKTQEEEDYVDERQLAAAAAKLMKNWLLLLNAEAELTR